jgi:DNA-binding transcriptional LysR family regulator
MPHNIDMDLLRALVAVADAGGFSRAAGALNRTQSAVSMQIKRLEEVVGHPLFDRTGRVVLLTPQGETLMSYAKQILRLNDEAYQILSRPELEGTVRLGCPDDYAGRYLPSVLSGFACCFPRVRVDVHCDGSGALIDSVAADQLDLAIATRLPDREQGEFLLRDRLVWVTAPHSDVLSRDPLPLAVGRRECIFRQMMLPELDRIGRRWHVAYESRMANGMQPAVEAGLATMVLLRSTVPPHLKAVISGPDLPELPELELALHQSPAGAKSAAVQYLAEHILEVIRGGSKALAA